MKLTIHTPERGDYTVAEDEFGNIIYEGHDRFNELTQIIAERFYDDIKYVEYSDEEFEEKF